MLFSVVIEWVFILYMIANFSINSRQSCHCKAHFDRPQEKGNKIPTLLICLLTIL